MKNAGEVRGEHQVVLKVDYQETETKTVALAAGATETVHFTLMAGDDRTYTVTVSGMTATFVVGDRLVRFSAPTGFTPFNKVNALMDFDSDGDLDLVVPLFNWPPAPAPVLAFRNDGAGNLIEATEEVFGGMTVQTTHADQQAVADFNGDGLDDLCIADQGPDLPPFPCAQNRILIQNENGQLIEETATRIPQRLDFTHSAAAWNIDGDGDVDIYVGNGGGRVGPRFLINDGSGFFTDDTTRIPSVMTALQRAYTACLLLDIDRDGDLDLVLGSAQDSGRQQDTIILNDGTGRFSFAPDGSLPPRSGGPNACTVAMRSGDMDKDGWPDLVISVHQWGTCSYDPALQLLLNSGDGTFRDETPRIEQDWSVWELSEEWMMCHYIVWPVVTDHNDDGWPDILAVGDGVMHILFESSGGERFAAVDDFTDARLQHPKYPYVVVPGDVDGHGDLDMVMLYHSERTQQVLLRE